MVLMVRWMVCIRNPTKLGNYIKLHKSHQKKIISCKYIHAIILTSYPYQLELSTKPSVVHIQ